MLAPSKVIKRDAPDYSACAGRGYYAYLGMPCTGPPLLSRHAPRAAATISARRGCYLGMHARATRVCAADVLALRGEMQRGRQDIVAPVGLVMGAASSAELRLRLRLSAEFEAEC